jgi:ribonucleoside-diphosphate reductase alpha chain
LFTNGSRIDILPNSQSAKGQRRKRMSIEESALLNNELFQDALQPIVEVGRTTVGKMGIIDPEELNQQINFFSTSGFRASDEYVRCLTMLKGMKNLTGEFIIGGDWHIASWYGRCSTKQQMMKKKETMSPIAFAQNYLSKWVGSSDGSLVDISKLMSRRNLDKPEYEHDKKSEYFLGVDVARSAKAGNAITAVVVVKVLRTKKGKVKEYQVVNIFEIPTTLDMTAQASEVKKIKRKFNANMVCVDVNGLGIGLHDALLKESFDADTGESLGCWNTINTDAVPELPDAERCLYALTPQSANSQIITTFIDIVEGTKLRLLVKKANSDYDLADLENKRENVLPYLLTDLMIEEIANLKLKTLPSGKVTVEQVIKGYNKDKYSALAYILWYIKTFEETISEEEDDLAELLACVVW